MKFVGVNTKLQAMSHPLKMPLPYEPKRKNRWLITFPADLGIQCWVFGETQRPTIIYKKNFWGIKRQYIEPIRFLLRDPIAPSTSQSIYDLIIKNKSFSYELEMLDPTGVVVEKWEINNCEILKVDFGNLSYDNDFIAQIEMVVQPKNFKLIF